MRTVIFGALGAVAIVGFGSAAEAKCIRAGGQATAITNELATSLAKVALNTSIKNWGGKAVGKVKSDCKYEFVFSTCKASQRACK
jgi:hypothetical protein